MTSKASQAAPAQKGPAPAQKAQGASRVDRQRPARQHAAPGAGWDRSAAYDDVFAAPEEAFVPVTDPERAAYEYVRRHGGETLDTLDRAFFERRLGCALPDVRLHRGGEAQALSSRLGALAWSVGRHVVLGSDAPPLRSPEGRALLAHELVHVLQHDASSAGNETLHGVEADGSPAERQADLAADALRAGASFVLRTPAARGALIARRTRTEQPRERRVARSLPGELTALGYVPVAETADDGQLWRDRHRHTVTLHEGRLLATVGGVSLEARYGRGGFACPTISRVDGVFPADGVALPPALLSAAHAASRLRALGFDLGTVNALLRTAWGPRSRDASDVPADGVVTALDLLRAFEARTPGARFDGDTRRPLVRSVVQALHQGRADGAALRGRLDALAGALSQNLPRLAQALTQGELDGADLLRLGRTDHLRVYVAPLRDCEAIAAYFGRAFDAAGVWTDGTGLPLLRDLRGAVLRLVGHLEVARLHEIATGTVAYGEYLRALGERLHNAAAGADRFGEVRDWMLRHGGDVHGGDPHGFHRAVLRVVSLVGDKVAFAGSRDRAIRLARELTEARPLDISIALALDAHQFAAVRLPSTTPMAALAHPPPSVIGLFLNGSDLPGRVVNPGLNVADIVPFESTLPALERPRSDVLVAGVTLAPLDPARVESALDLIDPLRDLRVTPAEVPLSTDDEARATRHIAEVMVRMADARYRQVIEDHARLASDRRAWAQPLLVAAQRLGLEALRDLLQDAFALPGGVALSVATEAWMRAHVADTAGAERALATGAERDRSIDGLCASAAYGSFVAVLSHTQRRLVDARAGLAGRASNAGTIAIAWRRFPALHGAFLGAFSIRDGGEAAVTGGEARSQLEGLLARAIAGGEDEAPERADVVLEPWFRRAHVATREERAAFGQRNDLLPDERNLTALFERVVLPSAERLLEGLNAQSPRHLAAVLDGFERLLRALDETIARANETLHVDLAPYLGASSALVRHVLSSGAFEAVAERLTHIRQTPPPIADDALRTRDLIDPFDAPMAAFGRACALWARRVFLTEDRLDALLRARELTDNGSGDWGAIFNVGTAAFHHVVVLHHDSFNGALEAARSVPALTALVRGAYIRDLLVPDGSLFGGGAAVPEVLLDAWTRPPADVHADPERNAVLVHVLAARMQDVALRRATLAIAQLEAIGTSQDFARTLIETHKQRGDNALYALWFRHPSMSRRDFYLLVSQLIVRRTRGEPDWVVSIWLQNLPLFEEALASLHEVTGDLRARRNELYLKEPDKKLLAQLWNSMDALQPEFDHVCGFHHPTPRTFVDSVFNHALQSVADDEELWGLIEMAGILAIVALVTVVSGGAGTVAAVILRGAALGPALLHLYQAHHNLSQTQALRTAGMASDAAVEAAEEERVRQGYYLFWALASGYISNGLSGAAEATASFRQKLIGALLDATIDSTTTALEQAASGRSLEEGGNATAFAGTVSLIFNAVTHGAHFVHGRAHRRYSGLDMGRQTPTELRVDGQIIFHDGDPHGPGRVVGVTEEGLLIVQREGVGQVLVEPCPRGGPSAHEAPHATRVPGAAQEPSAAQSPHARQATAAADGPAAREIPRELHGAEVRRAGEGGEATGEAVIVHVELGALGLVRRVWVEAGPDATAQHVLEHGDTVRLMERFRGMSGAVYRVLSAMASVFRVFHFPPIGSKPWRAMHEIVKLPDIIRARAEEAQRAPSEAERDVLNARAQDLREQLAGYHRMLLDWTSGELRAVRSREGLAVAALDNRHLRALYDAGVAVRERFLTTIREQPGRIRDLVGNVVPLVNLQTIGMITGLSREELGLLFRIVRNAPNVQTISMLTGLLPAERARLFRIVGADPDGPAWLRGRTDVARALRYATAETLEELRWGAARADLEDLGLSASHAEELANLLRRGTPSPTDVDGLLRSITTEFANRSLGPLTNDLGLPLVANVLQHGAPARLRSLANFLSSLNPAQAMRLIVSGRATAFARFERIMGLLNRPNEKNLRSVEQFFNAAGVDALPLDVGRVLNDFLAIHPHVTGEQLETFAKTCSKGWSENVDTTNSVVARMRAAILLAAERRYAGDPVAAARDLRALVNDNVELPVALSELTRPSEFGHATTAPIAGPGGRGPDIRMRFNNATEFVGREMYATNIGMPAGTSVEDATDGLNTTLVRGIRQKALDYLRRDVVEQGFTEREVAVQIRTSTYDSTNAQGADQAGSGGYNFDALLTPNFFRTVVDDFLSDPDIIKHKAQRTLTRIIFYNSRGELVYIWRR